MVWEYLSIFKLLFVIRRYFVIIAYNLKILIKLRYKYFCNLLEAAIVVVRCTKLSHDIVNWHKSAIGVKKTFISIT